MFCFLWLKLPLKSFEVKDFVLQNDITFPVLKTQLPNKLLVEKELIGDLAILNNDYSNPYYYKLKTDNWGYTNPFIINEDSLYSGIILGNSFAISDYYSEDEKEQSWAALYQRKNNRVVNLSVVGSTIYEQTMALRHTLKKLDIQEGSTIIWCIMGASVIDENDFGNFDYDSVKNSVTIYDVIKYNINNIRIRSGFVLGAENLRSHLFLNKNSKSIIMRKNLMFFSPYVEYSKLSAQEVKNKKSWTNTKKIILATKESLNKKRLDLKIIYFPSKPEVYHWVLNKTTFTLIESEYSKQLEILCKDKGISFVNLSFYLQKVARKEFDRNKLIYLSDDTHMNASGHKYVFSYLDSILAQ